MQRLILRLSAALLTFVLGVAASAIYSMRYMTVPDIPEVNEASIPAAAVETSCYPGLSIELPASASSSYFPSGILSHNEHSDHSRGNWYSSHLKAMYEMSFYYSRYHSQDRWGESYRFLWLRSFHNPVAVRIWESGSERFINVKELDGAGGYEPGKLIRNHLRGLTADEWSEFKRRLDRSCYWQLPNTEENFGLDGSQWILEGVKGGRYHVVDRWTPTEGGYHELCLYALQLAGLAISDDVTY